VGTLSRAVLEGDAEAALACLRRCEGSVRQRDQEGRSLLMVAVSRGYRNVVRALLQHGAPAYDVDRRGRGLGRYAAEAPDDDAEQLALLLDRGACPDLPDERGHTPLMSAAARNHEAMVDLLIDRGAQVRRCRDDGYTALMGAAAAGARPIVEALLVRGAPADVRDDADRTPLSLHLARDDPSVGLAAMLIEAGSPPGDLRRPDLPAVDALLERARRGPVWRYTREALAEGHHSIWLGELDGKGYSFEPRMPVTPISADLPPYRQDMGWVYTAREAMRYHREAIARCAPWFLPFLQRLHDDEDFGLREVLAAQRADSS